MNSLISFFICILLFVIINPELQASNRKFINPNQKRQFNQQNQQNLSNSKTWTNFKRSHGTSWSVLWDELTTTPYLLNQNHFQLPLPINEMNVESKGRQILSKLQSVFRLSDNQFNLISRLERDGSWYLAFRQVYNNYPVYSSRIHFKINPDGKVSRIRSNVFPDLTISVTPSISQQSAVDSAKMLFNFQQNIDSLCNISYGIFPVINLNSISEKFVYVITLADGDLPDKWMYFVDAELGNVITNRRLCSNDNISGTVLGYIYPEYPPEYAGSTKQLMPWQSGEVNVRGAGTTYTNELGYYHITAQPAIYTISSGPLQGEHLIVYDNDGEELSHFYGLYEEMVHDWIWNEDGNYDEETDDEINVWYHATDIYQTVKNEFGNFAWDLMEEYDGPMEAYVRDGDYGNAYYSDNDLLFGTGNNIPNCNNPALDSDVIYHEYGHAITDHIYPKHDGWASAEWYAMDEGFSDYWAALMNIDPQIIEGLNLPNEIRNLDNQLIYPDDMILNNHHFNGQIIGGAIWDMRNYLDNNIAEQLFFNAHFEYPDYFYEYLEDVLLKSDEQFGDGDGIVDINTPYLDPVLYAFGKHGIFPIDPNIPPAAPFNLQVTISANEHPFLVWDDFNESSPDLSFEIYRKRGNDIWRHHGYSMENSYEDLSIIAHQIPQSFDINVWYKITTMKISGLESNYSNIDVVYEEGGPFYKPPVTNEPQELLPKIYMLYQNYPNPFNPKTKLTFDLPEESTINLEVYNLQGKVVQKLMIDKYLNAGKYSVEFNAQELSSGIYFYKLTAGNNYSSLKRMVVLK